MTQLCLYAFADRAPAAGTCGLWGEPLSAIDLGRFFAAFGTTEGAAPLEAWALRGHDEAVRRVAASSHAVLPVRFGQLFESESSLREAILPLGERLRSALEEVAGCEQMTLRLFGEAPAREPATSGTAYLRSRRDRGAGIGQLRPALADVVVGERIEAGSGQLLATAYHLVRRGRSGAYLAALESARATLPALRFAASGPWAPYAFAPEVGA
ncbi:MAG: GvpL/GvpF family gas vesicle protein [Myxococcales bacterium]